MKTILWIDDDRKLLNASVEVFREYDFELVKATNTSRALTILRAQKLDGVLLDVRLRGGEDGLELLQELRRLYPSLQVVIFTGYPGYDDHVIARRLGASFYFEKVRKQIPAERAERRKFFAALHQIFETTPPQPGDTPKPAVEKPLSVFCSYSHRDAKFRDKLEDHLASLKRSGVISTWHDRKIGAGKDWGREIGEQLNAADIILLLVSPNFIASDYCNDVEIRRALERHVAGEARVIPVILRPTDWKDTPFSKLQALPLDAKPVSRWADRDEAFLNIAMGINKIIEEIRGS